MAAKSFGNDARCAASKEAIHYNTAGRAASFDAVLYQLLREDGKVGIAEFRKRDRPDCTLVASFGVKGLVPSCIMQIGVAAVLALLWRTALFEEVIATTFHPTVLGECDVWFTDRVDVVEVLLRLREEKHVLVIGRGPRLHG